MRTSRGRCCSSLSFPSDPARDSSRRSERISPWLKTRDCGDDGDEGKLSRAFSRDSRTAWGEMSRPWMWRLGMVRWRRE